MTDTSAPNIPVPDTGLRRDLKNRHIQMIAIGGAIGTGLFYGSSASIGAAGPAVLLAFALGGVIIFLAMRALGEMSVDTPVSGSFSFYAYRNIGPFAGFFSGWNYWFNYVCVSMAELTAVGVYVNFWWPGVPRWVSAAIFMIIVTAVNLISVALYGELEFWFAIIKVVAIIAMIIFGLLMVFTGLGNSGVPIGLSNLWSHGGFLPNGIYGLLACLVVVIFSFGGVELIGITAGEADDPGRSIPRAINQVLLRILIFYIGALFVIMAIFPWNKIDGSASPFVLVFDKVGIPAAATILNIVVLTAAASAYNSGLYSLGRMLYALSKQGNAPAFLGKTNSQGSPYVGILVSSGMTAIAVLLNYLDPNGKVFIYLMSVVAIACVFNWGLITYTQMRFRKRIGPEAASRLHFKMPLYPLTNYLIFAFLILMVIMMFQLEDYRPAVIVGPIWIAFLYICYLIKRSLDRRHGRDSVPTEADEMAEEVSDHYRAIARGEDAPVVTASTGSTARRLDPPDAAPRP